MASRGKDVHETDGLCRVDPGSSGIMEIEREVKSNACGILTLKRCRALRRCDEHGLADLRDHIFEDLDAKGFAIEARGASAGACFSRRAHGRRVSTGIRAGGATSSSSPSGR